LGGAARQAGSSCVVLLAAPPYRHWVGCCCRNAQISNIFAWFYTKASRIKSDFGMVFSDVAKADGH
jgi:hypothetical protein